MSSPRLVSALVLSPTPPPPEVRAHFLSRFGPDVTFADLPSLRRSGLRASVAWLRRLRVGTVVVTGSPLEMDLFQDYLVVLSFFVRAGQRQREHPGETLTPIHHRHFAASVLRIPAGVVAGAVGLVRAWLQVLWLGRERPRRFPLDAHGRCLYLKPGLSFGVSVGGSVAHVAGIVNAFARAGIGVHLLSTHEQPIVDASVRQLVVPPRFLIAFPFELNQHRYQSVFLHAAARQARDSKPDFIYQRYGLNDLSGLLMRRRLRVPLVLEFNGSEVWAQRHWGQPLRFERLASAIERVNLRHADLVVVVSNALVDQSVSLGASPERVLLYPNGIDPIVFDPDRFTRRGPPCDASGARDSRRGRASDVRRDLRPMARYRRPGGGDPPPDRRGTSLAREARRPLPLRGRRRARAQGSFHPGAWSRGPLRDTRRLPTQTEAPRILAASDILLSPHVPNPDGTPFFGSPTKLFEYMAMAKPIVASDLDQVGWVLKGWRAGEPLRAPTRRVHRRPRCWSSRGASRISCEASDRRSNSPGRNETRWGARPVAWSSSPSRGT